MEEKHIPINATYREDYKSLRILEWEKSRPAEWKEYRRKWEENPKNQDPGNFPIHLDIESTRTCNLRCPMCPRTVKMLAGEKLMEGSMDFSLYKKIIDEGSENGLCSIKLSYLGEPLMCKDIMKMVKYAKDKGVLDIMFNTNGVLLTEDMSRKLIEAGITGIFISFDSPVKEHYEKIRVGATFEKVFENVKNLVKIRKEMNSFFPIVRVSMTVMKENENEIEKYMEMWKPIVDIIGFGQYVDPHHKDKMAEERRPEKLKEYKNFICSQLYQRLFIHWNGKIGLCCADYDAEIEMGNARNVSIKSVWLGEKMQNFRKLHKQGMWHKMPLCTKCDLPYSE